jgi:hypothetical protein
MALLVGGSPITPEQLATLRADLGIPESEEITERYTSLVGTDDAIFLRSGVPGLVSADVMADTFGGGVSGQSITQSSRFNNSTTYYSGTVSLAGGGGGTATWQSFIATAEGTTLTPAAPAGLISGDLQVAVIFGSPTADAYTGPAGWTLAGSVHTTFAGGTGLDVWTASGATAQGTWTFSSGRVMEIHRISGASGVRAIEMREANTFVREAGGFWLDWPNMPSPSATAVAGDAVLAVYYGPQNTHAFGTPPTDYTRATSRTAPNTQGTMYRSNAPAGATGVLSHGVASGAYEERASATIILAAA